MLRKIAYWLTTGIMAALSLFAAFTYLSGNPKAVEGFAHLGYPQRKADTSLAISTGHIMC